MKTNIDNGESLWKLREFCSNPPQGMISHWWFNGLVNAFPLQFLFYTQYSTHFIGTKKTAREKIIKRFEYKIEKILTYRITETEIEVIESMWVEMDKLIEKNKKITGN